MKTWAKLQDRGARNVAVAGLGVAAMGKLDFLAYDTRLTVATVLLSHSVVVACQTYRDVRRYHREAP